ncbi:hypothetical protein AC1031_004989 [Aphanomyces cochlioides]|nr:hypothetical protein AC1031_004989 [Aphanomyces cochlioides]
MADERANWSEDKDTTWMTEMVYQVVVLGKRANSGFKKEAWQAALTKLNLEHNVNYTKVQLKARNAEMKKMYAQVSQIVTTSGIGFESSTCRFVCTEGSWQHFLIGKPKRWALWETKRFPQYPLCQKLYDGTLATGEYASSSTNPNRGQDGNDSICSPRETFEHCNSDDGNNGMNLLESDTSEDEALPQERTSKRNQKRAPTGSGTVKRHRPSMASAMVSEMQLFRESGQNEVAQIVNAIKDASCQQSTTLSASEKAVDLLQSAFNTMLTLDEIAIACEIMEDNKKTALFLRMNNEVKHAWLTRQISKQDA